MNSRSFIIVFTAALLMIAVLYSRNDDFPQGQQQLILPDLSAVLNDIERVTVIGPGRAPIATLERKDQHWTLAERDGYRADVGRIRKNLIALAGARIVEQKTSDPELYSRLGVEDLAGATATGKELFVEAPSESFRLIVGKTGVRGKMAYVRRPDAEATFMILADLDLGDDTLDWLQRDLLDIDSGRISSITITHPDGEVLRIEKSSRETPTFALVDIPGGRELQFATVLDPMAATLSGLTIDDVEAVGAEETSDAQTITETSVQTRFETFDGLVIQTTLRETEDGPAVRFSVRADAALAERFAADSDAAGKLDGTMNFATVSEEAQRLNAELDGWVYTLPTAVTGQLTQHLEDVLKPAE